MTTQSRGRSRARRIGIGALGSAIVASTLLVASQSPASADTITVNPQDIRGDETTYAGWHQGYANAALNAAITSGGLSLRGQSQIINGYADNDNADLAFGGVNANLLALAGAQYNVTSGSAFFQVPLFVDADDDAATPGTFTTLRPASGHSGNAAIAGADTWVSSKSFGDVTAGTEYSLAALISAVNAHKSKTLAFGVLTTPGSSATVQSITFDGDTYNFAASPVVSSTVTNADIEPEETSTNYSEWHQGYAGATARHQVTPSGLLLAGQSQIIKGFSNNSDTLNSVNANLQFVLPEASYTVAPGSDPVYFQVPVKFNDGSGLKFTTLRNNGETAGQHGFTLTDQWQSSRALDGIPANTDAPLSDIIAALGNYKTIAVGVLTNAGDVGSVSKIDFGSRSYTFADTVPAAGSTSLVPVRTIAPDESTYAGWHQGAVGGTATAAVDSNVLNLGATKSQVINGYPNNSSTLDTRNVNLVTALTTASYTVTSGNVYFQVPLFVEDPVSGSTVFTTLRPADPATAGLNRINVGQVWRSSKTVGPITANEPYLLGDILSAFKTYKVLAFGVFSDTGDNGRLTDITWSGVRYTFTGNRSPATGNVSATTTAGKAVTVTLPGSDADGDTVTFTAPNVNGTSQVSGTSLKYTPATGFVGTTAITYTATDSLGASRTGTVTVRVNKATTTLALSNYTGPARNTFIRVTPKAPGGLVNGAKVDIRRNTKPVASGTIVNGTVRLQVGAKLPKGTYYFGIYYRGTTTTTPTSLLYKVIVP
ncbi:MAG: Ig-like domain-containing protein [Propionibacteriales bacterium]|nr:Ig-like domain-containing protein [Propionibacteriales bacterium]